MAKIVAVHGIGQQYGGENLLQRNWLPALRDGLPRAAEILTDSRDFVCAFYGDLFRPKGKATDPPYSVADVTDDWEVALLAAWGQAAIESDPKLPRPDANNKGRTPNFVQRGLNALSRLPFFKTLVESVMINDLKQVGLYMNDDEVRAKVQDRVAAVIDKDTRVMIGHSLGSVVAYEALCAHPEWPIRTLVTLGSPLGIRNLIFDYLRPPPDHGIGAWPAGLERWTNIADSGDVVALSKSLGRLFAPSSAGTGIHDVLIHTGARAHEIEPYLTAKETGDAIANGLR